MPGSRALSVVDGLDGTGHRGDELTWFEPRRCGPFDIFRNLAKAEIKRARVLKDLQTGFVKKNEETKGGPL